MKTPLIYHELFGCYVPSLWTLRTLRADCSSFYQQFTGMDFAILFLSFLEVTIVQRVSGEKRDLYLNLVAGS